MTTEDLVLEGAHAVMRITKREVDWNTAVRISRCIMAMQDVSVVKDSLTDQNNELEHPVEFNPNQWWVKELNAMKELPGATDDQKRAVAVVNHLLASISHYLDDQDR